MRITVHVSIGLAGCRRERSLDIDDGCTDDEIEEAARETMFEMVSWGWIQEKSDKRTRKTK